MRAGVPRRTTVVWFGLVLATCATWWLGAGPSANGQGLHVMVATAIVVAFLKVAFIGNEFMELRDAPTGLRLAFLTWVAVVATAATTLYLL